MLDTQKIPSGFHEKYSGSLKMYLAQTAGGKNRVYHKYEKNYSGDGLYGY